MTTSPKLTASVHDQRYAPWLQDQETHALGFLPRERFPEYEARGQLLFLTQGTEPLGYLLRGPWKKRTRIYQIVIQEDIRLIEHATRLLNTFLAQAEENHVHEVTCWCASDLPANLFWTAIGFHADGTRCRRKDKRRHQTLYRYRLPAYHEHRTAIAKQLETDRLTRIRDFLCRTSPEHAKIRFARKHRS